MNVPVRVCVCAFNKSHQKFADLTKRKMAFGLLLLLHFAFVDHFLNNIYVLCAVCVCLAAISKARKC